MNNLGMRRKKYRRTRRHRRKRQRGGGKKKAADKTRKLVKNARMRAREKTRKAREETRKFDEMMELFGHNNSNEFSYSNEYSSENDTQLPKKSGTYAQLPPLIQEGQVRRDVQTNGNAHQLASALGAYPRRRSPSPLPTFDVDEYFVSAAEAQKGVGFADILPIGSEIVGHGKRANGIRFYKVRMGPKNIPKGFENAGESSNSYVKEFDAVFPRGNGPFLEDEAEGLKELEKLVMDYIAKHPVAGAGGIYGENSNSNGGGRRRKRRKKRTRRKRRSRKTRRRRRRRRKQRGGFDPIPKFRYKPKVFLNASAPKEAPIPPKPWW